MATQLKSNEIDWEKCSNQLYEQIRYKVYQMKLPRWIGEEDDVAWDAVQDSMRKVLEYLRQVEKGEKKPVEKLEGMLYITALNSLRDRRRREFRLCSETEAGAPETIAHPSEEATENVYQEDLFHFVAKEIAHFPTKQRSALLVDLAGMMAFEEKPTTLQAAFRAEDIRLEEYRFCQPDNAKERSRHAALLYQANQRLKELNKALQTYLNDEDSQKRSA